MEEVPCAVVLTHNSRLGNFQIGPGQWANLLINYQTTDFIPIDIPLHMHMGFQGLITYTAALLALAGSAVPYNNSHPNSFSTNNKLLQNKTVISLSKHKEQVASRFRLQPDQIHTISEEQTLNFLSENAPQTLYQKFAENPELIGQTPLANTGSLEQQRQVIAKLSKVDPTLAATL